MADFISPLANCILRKANDLAITYVIDEIKGAKSAQNDLKIIKNKFTTICAVIEDAGEKQYTNKTMQLWLRDLKNLAYDIDDLLDEFAYDASRRSIVNSEGDWITRLRYHLSLETIFFHFNLSQKLRVLRATLEHVVAKKDEFDLTKRPIEGSSFRRDPLDVCSYVDKQAIIGRDKAKEDIKNILLSIGDIDSTSVLPIVGMGGIGKTALAKLVYNDVDEFDIKLWACVSHKFNIHKILEDIVKDSTGENTSNYTFRVLVNKIREILEGKKYILVLDDVWVNDDIKSWIDLKNMLNVGKPGSVILITTRLKKVASVTHTVRSYHLQRLSYSNCWSIFEKLAFKEGDDDDDDDDDDDEAQVIRNPKLYEIGQSIVKKCGGIPLVVQCFGSLLRGQTDEREWERIRDLNNFTKLRGQQYDPVKKALKLSYDNLPRQLRPCFAHLSLYPKNTVYNPVYATYCWSALGLLDLDLNNSYGNCDDGTGIFQQNLFTELSSRSMLQDVEWGFNKTVHECKIHDLYHDLAEDVLGDELMVVSLNGVQGSKSESPRHIAWGYEGLDVLHDKEFPNKLVEQAKKARTFMFRYKMGRISQSFVQGIICNMPCLRVLCLGNAFFQDLPISIGNLKHLRFLDLSYNTLIKSLPDTMCDQLLNLECLFLHHCEKLEELPKNIHRLIKLKFFTLTTRQTSLVGTNINKLPSLRRIFIDSCKRLVSLWKNDDIGRLTSLRSVLILGCPKLTTLPNSVNLLTSLDEIVIRKCRKLDLSRGKALNRLSNLRVLHIQGLPRMSCLPNGVRSAEKALGHLWIDDCVGLVQLPSWFNSFCSLKELLITNCPNLLGLPLGIRHLKSLQSVYISNCPHLSRRCASPNGADYYLIRHVPKIRLDGRTP